MTHDLVQTRSGSPQIGDKTRDAQVSVGKDFVIMGSDRVEVSPDGKKVTAYTDENVEIKPSYRAAAQGISISAEFNAVVMNGAIIQRAADGHLVIYALGTVIITRPAPANDSAAKAKPVPEIGDEMADGTIYAGISPDTHKPIYAKPMDEPGTYRFDEAAKHAENIGGGFRVPSKGELNVLWENRNKGKLKGTFNEASSDPVGLYWSSTPNAFNDAWTQYFNDGTQFEFTRYDHLPLRLVR